MASDAFFKFEDEDILSAINQREKGPIFFLDGQACPEDLISLFSNLVAFQKVRLAKGSPGR